MQKSRAIVHFTPIIIIITLAVLTWLAMAGQSLNIYTSLTALTFMAGVACWAEASRILWKSSDTLSSHLPIGMGFCAGSAILLIELRLGTMVSTFAACLIGLTIAKKLQTRRSGPLRQGTFFGFTCSPHTRDAAIVLTAVAIATLLMSDQLRTLSTLANVNTNTVVRGWSDLLLHANTTISLSRLPLGASPISTLDALKPLHPYHLGSYVLPALIGSTDSTSSPLLAYTAIVPPLGITLVALPILERLSQGERYSPLALRLSMAAIPLFLYTFWIIGSKSSYLDPAWLLLATPAVLYASATVVAGIQIASCMDDQSKSPARISLLAIAILLLTLLFKFQVFHSILMAATSVATPRVYACCVRRTPSSKESVVLMLSTIAGLAVLQMVIFERIGIGRDSYFRDFTIFLAGIADLYGSTGGISTASHWAARILLALSGAAILCGPLFFLGWALSNRNSACLPVPRGLVILILLSFIVGIFACPAMPWAPDEFQSRSWPLLSCIGLWLIAGYRQPKGNLDYRPIVALNILLAALAWTNLPVSKRQSAANPPHNDWTSIHQPLVLSSAVKKAAQSLAKTRSGDFFVVNYGNRKESNYILNDLPSVLASLSAKRPLHSRVNAQVAALFGKNKDNRAKQIIQRDRQLKHVSSHACEHTKGSKRDANGLYATRFIDREAGPILILCGLDKNGNINKVRHEY